MADLNCLDNDKNLTIMKDHDGDVEAPALVPKEQDAPSVVVTENDDCSTTSSRTTPTLPAGQHPRRRTLLLAVLGTVVVFLATILVVVLLERPSSNASSASSALQDGGDPPPDIPALPEYESGAGEDGAEEPVEEPAGMELPTELPFAEVLETPLPAFSSTILQGYQSKDEFQAHVTVAAKQMLNRIILQNVYDHYTTATTTTTTTTTTSVAQQAADTVTTAQAAGTVTRTSTASKTNNQEFDADEADIVKNDADHVFAAFGDYLVVWDLQGHQVAQTKMPPYMDDNSNTAAAGSTNFWTWAPPTYINAILLTPTHVVVMVDAEAPTQAAELMQRHQGTQIRIYTKPSAATNMQLELVTTHTLPGIYKDGRWLEDSQTLHIITTGNLELYPQLVQPLTVSRLGAAAAAAGQHLTPLQYVQAATELATTELIPNFVQALTRVFSTTNMLQLNAWSRPGHPRSTKTAASMIADITGTSATSSSSSASAHYQRYTIDDDPLRSFMQITSIHAKDIVSLPAATSSKSLPALPMTSAVFLAPTRDCMFYGTDNSLVVALVDYQFNETTLNSDEELFLIHVAVDTDDSDNSEETNVDRATVAKSSVQTTFHSVASLPGHLHAVHSLDIVGDDLRVATTVQKWFPLDRVQPLCGENTPQLFDDACMTEANWHDCFQHAIDGCDNLQRVGCPYEFVCGDDTDNDKQQQSLADSSSTDNFVIVFDISTPGEMVERGRVRIGQAHEVITTVRFGESFSYAMTFDQRDPFYVLNLEPGQPPKIAGSLTLNGFARYLHPLNDDATLLVGIGQNVSGTGLKQQHTGVMITVFDVSDPTSPVEVASHMLDKDSTVESYTNAEWDHKSVQYGNGKLIIPVTIYRNRWEEVGDDQAWFDQQQGHTEGFVEQEGEEGVESEVDSEGANDEESRNFEGFIVFNVGVDGVSEAFRINYLLGEKTCHYCNGALTSSRSILLEDGSLMTMFSDTVKSTDIMTGEELWTLNVTLEGAALDCCW